MARADKISILGLYTWDNNLFELMELPQELDKDTLVKNLLAELAELEILYPNPVVLKNLIGVWSAKNVDVWQRLYNTTQYDYNPIENYNRYEDGTESGQGTTHQNGNGKLEHYVAGFDSVPGVETDGLAKRERNENEQTSNGTTSTNGQHQLHAHGNIGVTTTQKLIREQRTVDQFNVYDIIINDFKMRFCVLVY